MYRPRLTGSASLLSLGCALAAASPALAAPLADATLPEVVVTADRPKSDAKKADQSLSTPLSAFTLTGEPLAAVAAAATDAAALMTEIPGVSVATGGGVSGLPALRGHADDRINVLTMGMAITSACGNHMNPPLSYVSPSRIGSIEVLSGVTPVSKGGDSIGGSIIVEPRAPRFAGDSTSEAAPGFAIGDGVVVHGEASTFWRSNGNVLGAGLNVSVADRDWSLEYDGAWTKGQNYEAGGGALVRSSLFEAQNHALTLARRLENGLLTFSAGLQDIPYQGYPNVRMDMLYNKSAHGSVRYQGAFDWGALDARAYFQDTRHYMNFLADKYGGVDATPTTGMPMYTRGQDMGWKVEGALPIGKADTLKIGNEFQHSTLDDWWPPVAGKAGMCCATYENINGGRRDRLGSFVEWEHVWSKEWKTLLGVRNDTVWMDTGDVQGYNSRTDMPAMFLYPLDAAAFNGRSHAKTDVNFDLTALARWSPNDRLDTEFGYARKTRSPNFYERYAWSTSRMAASMVTWLGDANGYVGDIDLKPEVAHTLSATFKLHDAAREAWSLEVTPYWSHVENYIDADRIASTSWTAPNPFVLLKFANHDAELWGFDANARTRLWESDVWGRFDLTGRLAYTRGRNLDTGDGLYRVMPLEGRIGLDHRLDRWTNHVDLQMVAEKTDVSQTRVELKTAGYALLNWRGGWERDNLRLQVGVDNILDQYYVLPLGGVDFTVFKTSGVVQGVAGPGRSFWASASIKF
ncbi:MAG: TonB-dependent receptor [Hyphomicrobiales bacterium]|nr:TonB-dependent receptor [Hyphomicrobiales bacterium]